MGEEKRNRITAAVTINAILLVFIIVAVLIAQVVQITMLKGRKNALVAELAALTQELDSKQDFIYNYEKDEEIQNIVLQLKKLGMTSEEILAILNPSQGNAN